jgi:hypothetical protein
MVGNRKCVLRLIGTIGCFILFLSLFGFAAAEDITSEVYWEPPNPTTKDILTIYAKIPNSSKIEKVILWELVMRHYSRAGNMRCEGNNLWKMNIGPYDRESLKIRLTVIDKQGESFVSDEYTINFGKYERLARQWLPWVIVVVVSLVVLRVLWKRR